MQNRRAHVRFAAMRYDVEPLVVCRITQRGYPLRLILRRIIVGYYVYLADAVYTVILRYGASSLIISCDIALYDHAYAHLTVATESIDTILDIVDREVVVTSVVQVACYALSFLVQIGNIENLTYLYQRRCGIGCNHRSQILVSEVIA